VRVSLYTARSNEYPYTTQNKTRILIRRRTWHGPTWSRPILMHICIFCYVLERNMHKDKCWQSQRILACISSLRCIGKEARFEPKRWCVWGPSGWGWNLLSGAEPSLPGPRPLRRDLSRLRDGPHRCSEQFDGGPPQSAPQVALRRSYTASNRSSADWDGRNSFKVSAAPGSRCIGLLERPTTFG
jgi:hypothetical protein